MAGKPDHVLSRSQEGSGYWSHSAIRSVLIFRRAATGWARRVSTGEGNPASQCLYGRAGLAAENGPLEQVNLPIEVRVGRRRSCFDQGMQLLSPYAKGTAFPGDVSGLGSRAEGPFPADPNSRLECSIKK